MKEIKLNKGQVAIVDDADYAFLSQYRWHAKQCRNTFYVQVRPRNGATMTMHRLLLGAPKGMEVDHIDGNGLDNRRSNLRLCTHAENCRNRRFRTDGVSKYKGVFLNRYPHTPNKWRASVFCDGKRYNVGSHPTEEAAALAYNKKAKEVFGEFARLNVVSPRKLAKLDPDPIKPLGE